MVDQLTVLVVRLMARLPLAVVHAWAWLIGWLLYLVPSRPRHYAWVNLKLCFPELGRGERRRLMRRSLIEFAKTLVETPRLWLGDKAQVLSLVREVSGEEHIRAGIDSGKGTIIVCPHLGNWEMVGLYCSQRFPMTSMYRPQRNQALDAIIKQSRERYGAQLVPSTNKGLRQLLQALQRAELIGTLPDQNPGAGTGVFVPFFGVNTYSPVFAARLAARTGAAVVNVTAERLPRARGFHIRITPASDCIYDQDVEAGTACMNSDIEALIRTRIEQYWWSYNRFRTRPEGEPPIY